MKVPGPLTSPRSAANSEAIVMHSKLKRDEVSEMIVDALQRVNSPRECTSKEILGLGVHHERPLAV